MAQLPAAGRTIAIVLAIALAAVATLAIWRYVDTADVRAREDVDLVEVFRANGTIRAGTRVDAAVAQGLFERSEELRAQAPEDAIAELGDIAGLVARTDILPGDVIRRARFGTAAEAATLFEIPEDKVAVSVQVGVVEGVAGFVSPGDFVSVLAHIEVPPPILDAAGNVVEIENAPNETRSQFLLQAVEVLAIGQRVEVTTETGTRTQVQVGEGLLATLALDHAQAEKLVFAINEGTLHFALLPTLEDEDAVPVPVPSTGRTFTNLYL